MIKIEVHNLKAFENFLIIAGKFVQQGQLVITKEKSSFYCKNPKEFSTSRLLLDTNLLTINKNEEIDLIKICIRDIIAFRSSISIIDNVEQVETATLLVEEFLTTDNEYVGKSIQYKGKTKFKLISVDFQVIEQYISKELSVNLNENWVFNIDPVRLDIIQNRTGNIVNVKDDVSVYLYTDDETKHVMVDLNAKHATYVNHIALPIAEESSGCLPDHMKEVAIHESSFRLMNILRVTDKNDLRCAFSEDYNVFLINSELKQDNYYIKSRLLISIIKGK